MTGGEVYLYKPQRRDFINREYLTEVPPQPDDFIELHELLQDYLIDTGSKTVELILQNWDIAKHDFMRLVPLNTLKKKKVPATASAKEVGV
jgi:glutamate synthase domain-containing protein 3